VVGCSLSDAAAQKGEALRSIKLLFVWRHIFYVFVQPLFSTMSTDLEKQAPVVSDQAQTSELKHEEANLDTREHSETDKSSLEQSPQDAAELKPANAWADPSSFPDGGAKAWLTVAAASACFFVSWGWINCIGVFQDYCEDPSKTVSGQEMAGSNSRPYQ
jgi:hypothetical protein